MAMKKQQAEIEILRPNFGQHTPAIDELLKLLSQTSKWRDSMQASVSQYQATLREAEQRLADHNRKIESYRNAIRALGGKAPNDGETG
jgi:chromosome segregation ATPase